MSQGAAYFIAGWFTCAIMSGALLMLAVHATIREDQAQEPYTDPRDSLHD